MTLDEEQKSIIRTLVSHEVAYQETYLEVYDHIMSTLETRDCIGDFQKAYGEVLKKDFGGHSGIERLEETREWVIRKEIIQKKWRFFFEFFKGPAVIVSLTLGVFCYYGFHNKHFTFWLLLATVILSVLPFFIFHVIKFISGLKKKEKENKKSINENALSSAATMIFSFISILNLVGFLIGLTPLKSVILFPKQFTQVFESVLFLFATFYAVAVLHLYKNEFWNSFFKKS
jgi:hypothetical protein